MKKLAKGSKVRLNGTITRSIVKNGMFDIQVDGSEQKSGIRVEAAKVLRKKWWGWR
jgi:hypothetical protein